MNRRDFLRLSAATALSSRLVVPARVCGADATPARTITLGSLPLLFVDDGAIARNTGTKRTFHPARTRPEPVLVADKPWEHGRVYHYGSVMYDEASRQFRLWYGTPKPSFVLYATSRDGVAWEKPSLGLHDFEGSGENNICVENVHSASLLFDTRESDPAKRYKLIGAREASGYQANYSPDGIHWTGEPGNPVLKGDDTLSVTQDPATGDYLLYHKRQIPWRGYTRRTVWLARSRDFVTWSAPERVFAADEQDDAWAGDGQRTDVYNMAVFPHAGGFLGLPTMFRVQQVREKSALGAGQAGDDGPINVQIATSQDGRIWQRPAERTNIIPLGARGEFDRGAILGLSNQFVHCKDETWLYYTALNTTHGAPIPPKQLTIGRAEWRLHGIASLDAGNDPVRIETRPLRLATPFLRINASAAGGSVRVGLCDENGHALPGFAIDDCTRLQTDATQWTPSWKAGTKVPTDIPLQVVVELANASLYSISATGQGNDV